MWTLHLKFGHQFKYALEVLKISFKKKSFAEVIRLAVALLSIANRAVRQGKKIAILDAEGGVEKIIDIPIK